MFTIIANQVSNTSFYTCIKDSMWNKLIWQFFQEMDTCLFNIGRKRLLYTIRSNQKVQLVRDLLYPIFFSYYKSQISQIISHSIACPFDKLKLILVEYFAVLYCSCKITHACNTGFVPTLNELKAICLKNNIYKIELACHLNRPLVA